MEQLDQQGRKQGEFKVRLPDGRIQVTSYQAVSVDFYYENLREHSVLNPHKRFPFYYIHTATEKPQIFLAQTHHYL